MLSDQLAEGTSRGANGSGANCSGGPGTDEPATKSVLESVVIHGVTPHPLGVVLLSREGVLGEEPIAYTGKNSHLGATAPDTAQSIGQR